MLGFLSCLHKQCIWLLVVINLSIAPAYADKIKVAFINPSHPEDPFWSLMTNLMSSAADDLDIQLVVHYAGRNRFNSLSLAEQIVASADKPDYLVYHFQAQVAEKMLETAEKAQVLSVVINTKVAESDRQTIGEPGSKFKFWLGHLVPDDYQAGKILAKALINKWRARETFQKQDPIRMISLTGTFDNAATIERESGLKAHIATEQNVILQQVVSADWSKQKAAQVTEVLLSRYPETTVVWCASDLMAIGAIEAIEAIGRKPGVDILIGGIDGVDIGLDAVQSGRMAATVSGHFIEAAWAMLLIFEHFQGRDLFKAYGPVFNSSMFQVDAENVRKVQSRINLEYFNQIDFNEFTGGSDTAAKRVPLLFPEKVLSSISGS